MDYEKSCGGVVFTRENDTALYLIIRHPGGHYGFPKGHMEPDESEEETALREIQEEVGLSVSLIDGFRAEEIYLLPNKPGTQKLVVYFLAAFADQSVRIQPEEVAAAYLLPYAETLELLTFPEAKRILTEAHQFVTQSFK